MEGASGGANNMHPLSWGGGGGGGRTRTEKIRYVCYKFVCDKLAAKIAQILLNWD